MKLVFVHGRAQGGRTSAELRDEWTTALTAGYAAGEVDPVPAHVEIAVPFYGDELDAQTHARKQTVEGVVTRGEAADGDVPELINEILEELQTRAGVTNADVRAELVATHGPTAFKKGPENWEWVQASARALSKRVPWLTERVIAEFLADVDTYLNFPQKVDRIVTEAIAGDTPVVVVSHSLGTVVSYNVLTALGAMPKVKVFVTLGSPLGIRSIKKKLKTPLGIPEGVSTWFNAADERDVVALYSRLDKASFLDGIENLTELRNPRDKPHAISGYLGDGRVARRIAQALST